MAGTVKNYLPSAAAGDGGKVVRLDGDQQHKRESADVLVLTPEVSFPVRIKNIISTCFDQ
jgi:hypothetical protein